MTLYLALWRAGFQEALQYRVEMFIWVLFDVVPPIMMAFLWLTVYEGQESVAGYSLGSMLQYTLWLVILRNVLTAHVEWEIVTSIRQGTLSTYLARPFNTWGYWFFNGMGKRAVRAVLAIPTLLISLIWLGPYLKVPPLDLRDAVPLLACLALAYLLSFFMKITVGFLGFWLTEISGVVTLVEIMSWIFGGMLLPLELLPDALRGLAAFLPFQYIYFVPMSGLLGRLDGTGLGGALLMQLAWIGALAVVAGILWRAGLWRYEAYGG